MGMISIAAFRPLAGKEEDLQRVIDERLPLLRRLGLATERREVRVRARSGVVVTISEWASQEAIDRAHRTPEVLALWNRFWACAEPVPLAVLEETAELFATFEAIAGDGA